MKDFPAFPLPEWQVNARPEWATGLTLRDFFAALTAAGIHASYPSTLEIETYKEIAEMAYKQADALLEQRTAKPQTQETGHTNS